MMSVRIAENCVTCGACVWECPTQAIAPGTPRPVVEPEACTECWGFFGESQCMVVCPVAALVRVPESVDRLAERYRVQRPELPPQDTWIWQPGGRVSGRPHS